MVNETQLEHRKRKERFFYPEETVIDKPFNWGQMLRLLTYMKPYAKTLLPLSLLAMLVGTGVRLVQPYLISMAIDHAIVPKNFTLLFLIAGGMAFLYLLSWFSSLLKIRWTNLLGQSIIFDLRSHLFRHIQRLSHRFFEQRSAGSILVRIMNDVNALQDLFTNGVINVLMDFVFLIGITGMLLVLSPKLTLAVMVVLPLMFLISTKLRQMIRRSWQTVRLRQSMINSHLNESIQGIRVTQSFVQEQENMNFFQRMNRRNFEAWKKATKRSALFPPLVEFSGAIGTVTLIGYGSTLLMNHELTIGSFVAFSYYLGSFWEPISRLGQVYNQLLMGMASSERIFEFLDEKPNVPEQEDPIPLPEVEGDIRFEEVYFSYDGKRSALNGITLHVKPGETVALVGHTGSGKTSIANLICRFYDPTGGRILLDGHDLRTFRLEDVRSRISIVLQETFIFSGTIMENIRFGRPDASDEEVMEAARVVGADEFIERLPNGYRTEVEERGNALSVGQRQLLSFARAILADPSILILDEATASIDTESEIKIQKAMKELLAGRTAVIIAHRLSTIREADKIFVLDHGRILEEGNHEELMAKRGQYYDLVVSQFKSLG
ncbi:ABC transporter ATP-binding protein [Thermicanus aegyptius]|uniref:ABC transporter ATP-binding protein n=1 Tax=Thermicanus aegyptius TaxID=94009 RepID=UPI0006934964|nr:ABC transporter ATP-binding protein [Thermicanus aegyptius]